MFVVHFCTQVRDKVERHRSWFGVKTLWEYMCSKVQAQVMRMGFSLFLTMSMLKVDWALMMALVERWSPVTYTFSFTYGRDWEVPHWLLHDDKTFHGQHPSLVNWWAWFGDGDELHRALAYRVLQGNQRCPNSWFETKYVWAIDESSEEERDYSTRTFLLYMLTRSIFCVKSDLVYFWLLPALKDLDRVGSFSWDRSALGWMYSNMREVLTK